VRRGLTHRVILVEVDELKLHAVFQIAASGHPRFLDSLLTNALLAAPAGGNLQGRDIMRRVLEDGLGTGQTGIFFGGNSGQQLEKLLNAFHGDDLRSGWLMTVWIASNVAMGED
jgi:hypothetical protein